MINRTLTIQNLERLQRSINFRSDEDEGATEYYAEIQALINAVRSNINDDEITNIATDLNLTEELYRKKI